MYLGWPGSVHDARVFRNLDLWENGSNWCDGRHIIADLAYPLQEWVLTPYRRVGMLNREQNNYNKVQNCTRVVIERAFGLLKGILKRLQHVNVLYLKHVCDIIMACCVLHNICISEGDILPEFYDENDDNPQVPIGVGNLQGTVKRNVIAQQLLIN